MAHGTIKPDVPMPSGLAGRLGDLTGRYIDASPEERIKLDAEWDRLTAPRPKLEVVK